ncbi:MAG: thiol-disulfide isomerase/thioredoxin [Marivirga sp.]|jgi:thiol-disulfide isomerase/thioredoxin
MVKLKIVVIALFSVLSLSLMAQTGKVKIIKVAELLILTSEQNQNPRIINFWATWCKPCIKEMPLFIEAAKQFPEIDFIFISLDFADQVEKTALFAANKGMDAHSLYLIDDLDYDSWIDQVSPEWTGAIPATLFINASGKVLYEQEFEQGELRALLNSKLKIK